VGGFGLASWLSRLFAYISSLGWENYIQNPKLLGVFSNQISFCQVYEDPIGAMRSTGLYGIDLIYQFCIGGCGYLLTSKGAFTALIGKLWILFHIFLQSTPRDHTVSWTCSRWTCSRVETIDICDNWVVGSNNHVNLFFPLRIT